VGETSGASALCHRKPSAQSGRCSKPGLAEAVLVWRPRGRYLKRKHPCRIRVTKKLPITTTRPRNLTAPPPSIMGKVITPRATSNRVRRTAIRPKRMRVPQRRTPKAVNTPRKRDSGQSIGGGQRCRRQPISSMGRSRELRANLWSPAR
jgi:hypothetical protein